MARPIATPDEALVAAVAASPGATAVEVAAALGIGQSTAQKRLAALEAAGQVRRDPGGRVDGVRAPDRWHPLVIHDATAPEPDTGSEAVGGPEPAEDAPASADGSGRLGRGALAALVRDYLAERPKESFGPAALGKALGRSQGAISNALAAMAERGEAVLVADKPRRYRISR
jgi:DNA-binding MarR family transcriptional regulator